MYVEEFDAPAAWDRDFAELITYRAAQYSSRIMFTCNGFTVHAPVLPVSWDALDVRAGSTVLVTAERGRTDAEDARAVADIVDYATRRSNVHAGSSASAPATIASAT